MVRPFLLAVTALIPAAFGLPLSAQTTPATSDSQVRQTGYSSSLGDQEDEEKQALAKTLDDFQQRIKDLEAANQASADAQKDQSYPDRFAAIEKDVAQSLENIGKVEESLDDYAMSGHVDQRMKVFGRLHTDYWAFLSEADGIDLLEGGDPQDRFIIRRARIGVSGDVNDNMIYKVEIDFAGGNLVEYRDLYLGFTDLPCLQTLQIGNQKRPYGLDQLNSSNHIIFMERALAIEAFNRDARRLGICSYGHSDDLCYNWRFGVFNQEPTQAKFGYVGDHYQPELAGRLAKTWWWDESSGGRGYGHWGLSGSWAWPDGNGPNNQSRYRTRPEARSTAQWLDTGTIVGADVAMLGGAEGVLNVGPTQLVAEYQFVDVDRFNAVGPHVQFHGGYAQVSHFLTGEHLPWNRELGILGRVKPFENFFAVCDCEGFVQRGLGAWQIAARYSYADLTDQNIDGGRGTAGTIGLNWYWNPYARMMFNYIVGDIETNGAAGGDYQIAGVRFQIDY